jgi:hypothetical protein
VLMTSRVLKHRQELLDVKISTMKQIQEVNVIEGD